MNYEDLEIWKLANELVMQIQKLTIYDIPKFEMFEVGSQIRRSAKSIPALIVGGVADLTSPFVALLLISFAVFVYGASLFMDNTLEAN